MKIHLIKTEDISKDLFRRVIELLESKPGAFVFNYPHYHAMNIYAQDTEDETIYDEEQFTKSRRVYFNLESYSPISKNTEEAEPFFPLTRKTSSWETLFSKCEKYRSRNQIPENELIILLTNIANDKNWFSALNPNNPNHGFVHCDDWDFFIKCPDEFPIAYQVIDLALSRYMYFLNRPLMDIVHQHPRGCVNDFCRNKRDIILKLRTGDICPDCLHDMEQHIPMAEINHGLDLFSRFRERMLYAQNAQRNKSVSRLMINRKHQLFLVDYDNIEIKFTPLEKTLYFLFLKYPDGLLMSNLYMHRKELTDIYTGIYTRGSLREMEKSIADLSNATMNSASEKISSIKRKFNDKIGEVLAEPYIIRGRNAEVKRINLNRKLFINENNTLIDELMQS